VPSATLKTLKIGGKKKITNPKMKRIAYTSSKRKQNDQKFSAQFDSPKAENNKAPSFDGRFNGFSNNSTNSDAKIRDP